MDASTRLNVTVSGRVDGPPLVSAHGFGCDQHMWRWMAPHFDDRNRVVSFDHVGCGGSDESAWDPDRYANLRGYGEDVLDLVRELDLRGVVSVRETIPGSKLVLLDATGHCPDLNAPDPTTRAIADSVDSIQERA